MPTVQNENVKFIIKILMSMLFALKLTLLFHFQVFMVLQFSFWTRVYIFHAFDFCQVQNTLKSIKIF